MQQLERFGELIKASADAIRAAVEPMREALAKAVAPAAQMRQWAEDRIDRAMTCPECGHGAALDPAVRAEQAENCDCTDELCVCNDAVEYGEAPR